MGEVPKLPTVSIVIPSFNHGKFIGETLESVLSQDYPYIECIVQDGGSKDETPEVLKEFGNRIHWRSEADSGQSQALNRGLAHSTGEILSWISADDVYEPGAIRRAVEYLVKNREVRLVYGKARYIDQFGAVTGEYRVYPFDPSLFRRQCYIPQPTVFFWRSLYEKVGPLNERLQYVMDFEYWLRCLKVTSFGFLPEYQARYRLTAGSKTVSQRREIFAELFPLLRREFGFIHMDWIANYSTLLIDEQSGHFTSRWTKFVIRRFLKLGLWGILNGPCFINGLKNVLKGVSKHPS